PPGLGGSVNAPAKPAPAAGGPRSRARALGRLSARWNRQRTEGQRLPIEELPLSALLLHGLTYTADEGPALDILGAIAEPVEGWEKAATIDDEGSVAVTVGELMMLARRLEVAMELIRRSR